MIFDLCWVSSIGDDVSITPRSSRKFLNSGKLCSSLSLGDSRLEIPAGPMLVFHTRLMMHITILAVACRGRDDLDHTVEESCTS